MGACALGVWQMTDEPTGALLTVWRANRYLRRKVEMLEKVCQEHNTRVNEQLAEIWDLEAKVRSLEGLLNDA